MPGLTIRRAKDECVFMGESLDQDDLAKTFDHKVRVQEIDERERMVKLEVVSNVSDKESASWEVHSLNEEGVLDLGDTEIRLTKTYMEHTKKNFVPKVELEFVAPNSIRIYRDNLIKKEKYE